MAHGESLRLREIQPHPRQDAWSPNEWRQLTKMTAKVARISRRRVLRIARRSERARRSEGGRS